MFRGSCNLGETPTDSWTLKPENSEHARLWNNSENGSSSHEESHLKIDSWKYVGEDKRAQLGRKRRGNTQAGSDACTETVAIVLLGQQNVRLPVVCLSSRIFDLFLCVLWRLWRHGGLSDEGCVAAGLLRLGLLHKQAASVTHGHNRLKKRGEGEQTRNDLSNIAI